MQAGLYELRVGLEASWDKDTQAFDSSAQDLLSDFTEQTLESMGTDELKEFASILQRYSGSTEVKDFVMRRDAMEHALTEIVDYGINIYQAIWPIRLVDHVSFATIREWSGKGVRIRVGNLKLFVECKERKEAENVEIEFGFAQNLVSQPNFKTRVCSALRSSSEDLDDIRNALVKIVFPASITATSFLTVVGTGQIESVFGATSTIAISILAIIIWRAGVAAFCEGIGTGS